MEPTWQGSCSKEKLPGNLTTCSCLASSYQLSNDHALLGAEGACAATHQVEDSRFLYDRFGPRDERFADAFLFDQRSLSLRNSWVIQAMPFCSMAIEAYPVHIRKVIPKITAFSGSENGRLSELSCLNKRPFLATSKQLY